MPDAPFHFHAACGEPLVLQANHLAVQTLAHLCEQQTNITAVMADLLAPEHPFGAQLSAEDRIFLAEHFHAQTTAHADLVAAFLRKAPTESTLSIEPALLQQYFTESKGMSVDPRAYGAAGAALKSALSALVYALLRSGLLPEECDALSATDLVAGVCACIDVQAVAASITPQQQAFHTTKQLLYATQHAACQMTADLALSLQLSAALTPLCLQEAQQYPALLTRLNTRLLPLDRVQSGLLLLSKQVPAAVSVTEKATEKTNETLPVKPKLPLK